MLATRKSRPLTLHNRLRNDANNTPCRWQPPPADSAFALDEAVYHDRTLSGLTIEVDVPSAEDHDQGEVAPFATIGSTAGRVQVVNRASSRL